MTWRNDLYSEVSARFKEWIPRSNEGDYVTDIALDYINRANRKLNGYRPWKLLLIKRSSLTLSSRSASLPAACLRIWRCYEDNDNDGRPDILYYENSVHTPEGYYITETYAKATGITRAITFYLSPSSTPYIDYVQILPDFTGNGIEYLFFPGELLLAQAKLLYLEDDGRSSSEEYKMIFNRFQEEERDFTQLQAENFDMRMDVKDDRGHIVNVEDYSLNGGTESYNRSRYENDVDI